MGVEGKVLIAAKWGDIEGIDSGRIFTLIDMQTYVCGCKSLVWLAAVGRCKATASTSRQLRLLESKPVSHRCGVLNASRARSFAHVNEGALTSNAKTLEKIAWQWSLRCGLSYA